MAGAAKSGAFGLMSDLFDRMMGQSPLGEILYAYLDAFLAKVWGSVDWTAFAGDVSDIYDSASDIYEEVKDIADGMDGFSSFGDKISMFLQAIVGLLQLVQGDTKGWDKVWAFIMDWFSEFSKKFSDGSFWTGGSWGMNLNAMDLNMENVKLNTGSMVDLLDGIKSSIGILNDNIGGMMGGNGGMLGGMGGMLGGMGGMLGGLGSGMENIISGITTGLGMGRSRKRKKSGRVPRLY